jgi:hypothetical protein
VTAEATAEDQLAARRLTGLLDYVEALVKLDERVATRLTDHYSADKHDSQQNKQGLKVHARSLRRSRAKDSRFTWGMGGAAAFNHAA